MTDASLGTLITKIAVLVPTFRRSQELADCLNSIKAQSALERSDLEVVVIVGDNNSDASGRAVVELLQDDYPCELKTIQVPRVGLCANRNALFQAGLDARAEYFLLIDDDEYAHPGWIDALLDAVQEAGVGAAIGPVESVLPPQAPGWYRHSGLGHLGAAARASTGSDSPKLATNNSILTTEVLRRFGPPWFPSSFDTIGSEDRYFFEVAREFGLGRIVWCDNAVVSERVPPERCTIGYLVERSLQRGSSGVLAERLINAQCGRSVVRAPWRTTLFESLRLVAGVPAIVSRSRRHRYLRHLCYVTGRLAGHLGRYRAIYGQLPA